MSWRSGMRHLPLIVTRYPGERGVIRNRFSVGSGASHVHLLGLIVDGPEKMDGIAVNLPDSQNPIGSKGIGEPVMGSAASALLCAISDALGGHMFNRTPVLPDMILLAASDMPQSHKPLQVNTQ